MLAFSRLPILIQTQYHVTMFFKFCDLLLQFVNMYQLYRWRKVHRCCLTVLIFFSSSASQQFQAILSKTYSLKFENKCYQVLIKGVKTRCFLWSGPSVFIAPSITVLYTIIEVRNLIELSPKSLVHFAPSD